MQAQLLATKTFRLLREVVDEAVEEGVNAIVYGPPSTEKSFVLQNIANQFRAAGKPVIYAYCGPRCTLTHMYRTIAEAAGITVRSSHRWGCRYALLSHLRARQELPAIILDEAQHLDLDALEGVRELHDLTRRETRKGCGIILAGSHHLLREFLRPERKPRLEQMLSRFPQRVQLQGMEKQEILTLAARAFGDGKPAKLSEAQRELLLKSCTVQDPYFIGNEGKSTVRSYYSSRRLLEYVRQQLKRKPVFVN